MELQIEGFVRFMVDGPKLEELEVKNGFYDGFFDDAPRPEELLRAATAPPCGTREDEAEPESSSGSNAGEEVGERRPSVEVNVEAYNQEAGSTCPAVGSSDDAQRMPPGSEDVMVRAPNPARKLSGDEFGDLGQMAASAELGLSKVSPQVPQPQTLSCTLDSLGFHQVIWTVDARKLNSNDKQAVSPPFDLRFNNTYPEVTFKLMIYPKADPKAEQPKTEHASRKSEETVSRGAACFKKSNSGTIQLKCESDLSNSKTSVSFQLTIGNSEMRLPLRPKETPTLHTFSQSAMAGLPKEAGLDIWNLSDVVDWKSTTFYVYATIRTYSDVDDATAPL